MTATLDWERLARAAMHPTAVAILEILSFDDTPRSPVALADILDEPLGNVAHHMCHLRKCGLVRLLGTQQKRGAIEHFYGLSEAA